MPAAHVPGSGSGRVERMDYALVRLREALQILDEFDYAPEIGARLQGVIDEVDACVAHLRAATSQVYSD